MCDSIFRTCCFLLLFPLFLVARTVEERVEKLQMDMQQVRGQTAYENYGVRTPMGAYPTDGYGFFASTDFLWWKLYEGGTDYLFDLKTPLNTLPIQGPIHFLHFPWEPGYKVEIGCLFDHDGWDVTSQLTGYQTKTNVTKHKHTATLFPLLGTPNLNTSRIQTHWIVDFYHLNFLLGRNTFVSKYLTLRPFFGLSSAWFFQKRTMDGGVFFLKGKSNFWGIGPELGVNAQFFFCEHWSVYGDFFTDLLWGNFQIQEKEKTPPAGLQLYHLHSSMHQMIPAVGFGLGLAYEMAFDHFYTTFKLGYENQYWWRQNQFPVFDPTLLQFQRCAEDLSLQGLTVEARLDF